MTRDRLWTPLPGPQTEAYFCEADELFYGGQAGGGKTDLALGLAISAHKSSIIFRREFKQLHGAEGLIERSRQLLGKCGASYNGQEMLWRDIPGNRRLEFGACQYENDKEAYQGKAHSLKCFDELTHFTRTQYEYLIGWNRTTDPEERCRVVCTGNPPVTSEGRWVIEEWAPWLDRNFPNPAKPGELRWYIRDSEGNLQWVDGPEPISADPEPIAPKSRTFIPASVEDNPYLLETGYRATLLALPEPLRSAFAHGDFGVIIEDDPWQVIPSAWVWAARQRWEATGRPGLPLSALGVDVARGGKDKTVLAPRHGPWFGELRKYPGSSTPDGPGVAALVVMEIGDSGAVANVDVIGVGASVYDSLAGKVTTVGVNFAAATRATDKSGRLPLTNVRAEAYWKFREALDPDSGDNLALPPDDELLADLCAPKWTMRASGIQIESKEDIAKRINRSPDCGDAVVLAHYQGLSAADLVDWG